MLEAVRFPEDYDGIIAGAPAFQFLEMIPWMVGAHRAQSANPLTREALGVLDRASIRACDDLDGIADGVIGDPRQCTSELYDIDQLACKGGQVKDCLSPGQIETARYVYEDIVDSNGVRLSPGVLPGAEAAGDWGFWMLANEQFEGQSVISGIGEMLALLMRHEPDFKLDEFDPVTDRAAIANATSPLDVRRADLSEFRERGGKLLMYQGWNDWPLRPQRAIDFLSKVESASGGARQARDFYRLFMVPGMVHCAGGPGAWQADYVRPLVAWREKDEQPQRIIATHPDGPPLAHLDAEAAAASSRRFTRPLCVYPKLAQYRGRGDENDAANFRCVEP